MQLARPNAIVSLTAAANLTGCAGRFVTLSGGNATLISSALDTPFGVLLSDGSAGQKVSVAVAAGGLSGTVRVKLSGAVAAPGTFLQLTNTGTVIPNNTATAARVVCGLALEAGQVGELIECVMFNPIVYSSVDQPVSMLSGLYDHWRLATNTNSSLGTITVYPAEGGNPVFEDGGLMISDNNGWLTSTTTLPLETGFTVSAWVDPVASNLGSAVSQWLGGKGGFRLAVDSAPVRDFFAVSNTSNNFTSGEYVSGYYMLTGVYDALRSQVLLYRNNVLQSISYTSKLYSTAGGNAAVFQIGTIDSGYEFVYQGLVNNVAIWNRPFTQAQVTALYNGNTPLPFASYATTIA